jgi:hypothetical protein
VRNDRFPRPELTEAVQSVDVILLVAELLPDKLLRLDRVGRHEVGTGSQRELHRLTLGVDDGRDAKRRKLAHQLGVDLIVDPAREAARENADVGPLRQVQELVPEERDLGLAYPRPAFVDLSLLARGRIDHRGGSSRLLVDAHEVAQDRLHGELLADPRPRHAAREASRDHRLAKRLQGAGDVDALASRHRPLLGGAVAATDPEVGYRERLVDRGVERDGDDHDPKGGLPLPPAM